MPKRVKNRLVPLDLFSYFTQKGNRMLMMEFSRVLENRAKKYRKKLLLALLSEVGEQINDSAIVRIISPFVQEVTTDLNGDSLAIRKLWQSFAEFIPEAIALVKRNQHMHNANGSGVLDVDHADALLVSFINFAYLPGDLGLHTYHLKKK